MPGKAMTRNYLKLGASTLAMVIGATAARQARQNTPASTEQQVVVTGSRVITNGNDSPIHLDGGLRGRNHRNRAGNAL